MNREQIEAMIAQVENAMHNAANARRFADAAMREARNASNAAAVAEQAAHGVLKDLGAMWDEEPVAFEDVPDPDPDPAEYSVTVVDGVVVAQSRRVDP